MLDAGDGGGGISRRSEFSLELGVSDDFAAREAALSEDVRATPPAPPPVPAASVELPPLGDEMGAET